MTEPVTNLTTKFTALATTLGGKLDTIQTTLESLSAKVDTLATQTSDYSSIIAAITGILGDGNYTLTDIAMRLDAIWENTSNILLAIGAFEYEPANYTVKELLALLQTSIDSQPTDKPKTQNDVPYSGTWLRQASWKAYMPRSYSGTLYNVYSPVFSPIDNPYTLFRKDSSDNKRSIYLCDYGGTNTMSVAWNTTGHVLPVFVASLTKSLVIAGEIDNSFDDFSFLLDCSVYPGEGSIQATGSMDVATFAVNAQACGHGDNVVEWFVLYPEGVTPTYLDFFWRAS